MKKNYFDLRMQCIGHAGSYIEDSPGHKYWMKHYFKLASLERNYNAT